MTECPCKHRPCCHNPASRRIVILGAEDHGEPEAVLCEPEAKDLHSEVVKQAIAHPGRRVAGEFFIKGEWRRFLWGGERTHA